MQQLPKGANAPLVLDTFGVRVTWRPGPGVPSVDASALLCGTSGKVSGDDDFVFYNQPQHRSGAVIHRPSSGTGTDTLSISLPRVPADVDKIVIAASADGGTFGQVPGLCIEVIDEVTSTPAIRFDMDATSETAFIAAEIYRRGGAWKFRAIGQGYNDGLAGLARDYGITVDDEPTTAAPAPQSASSQHPPATGAIDWMNPPVPAGYEN